MARRLCAVRTTAGAGTVEVARWRGIGPSEGTGVETRVEVALAVVGALSVAALLVAVPVVLLVMVVP